MSQSKIESFLTPSDSLNRIRKNTVIVSEAVIVSGALIGLNELWYKDYPRSKFHFVNDNNEWLQMDKVGHLYSAYHLGSMGVNLLQWSGVSKKDQLLYGATLGFGFLTAVEVLDGFSQKWGASPGDVIANAAGTGLYVSQDLLWKEQRIVPKFSFHTTSYAKIRPESLGKSFNEQLLKDYNGQTYWLSVNVYSFFKHSRIPKWLNLAVGYGADRMLSDYHETLPGADFSKPERFRQYYFSLDLDLTKIKTKSHFLSTLFTVFNTIKVPAPTLEFSANQRVKLHFVYF